MKTPSIRVVEQHPLSIAVFSVPYGITPDNWFATGRYKIFSPNTLKYKVFLISFAFQSAFKIDGWECKIAM